MIFSHQGNSSWRGPRLGVEVGSGSEADYFRQLAENLTDLIVTTDTDLNLTYVSPSAERVLGYTARALQRFYRRQHHSGGSLPEEVTTFLQREMQRVCNSPRDQLSVAVNELAVSHRRGSRLCLEINTSALQDSSGRIVGLLCICRDITEKKNNQVRIQRLAYFDPLSGLPNRSLFNDRLARALSRAKRANTRVALMFLDLDRFKAINDSLGHALGDALLCQVAQRLRDCVRSEDTVARMGGDEFTIILGDLADRQQAVTASAHIAEKIRQLLTEPFQIESREVFTSTSIGIAFYPGDGSKPRTLLQNADTAMYHAKAAGKNNYQFYTDAMNAKAMQRLELETALQRAVRKAQFELHYQPILNARSGDRVGVEALVRWQHPDRGLILPGEFINIAEESGVIKSLGAWVLRRACEQMVSWEQQRLGVGRLAVNISAREFVEGYILQTLDEVISKTGIDPAHLELELTERALMQDHNYSAGALEALKELGVRIAIDDFGSGYSSLNHLKKLPIDTIKVDRSFIKGLPAPEDKRIVRAIVAMAHSLELKVIAEGVETPLQLEYVQELGCEEVQGFLLSKPVPAQQVVVQ